ncbi:MAG: methyltransferase type 12 [Methanomicrobiales archaeon HGW-Methanomicrobiales-4]|nr:MAG: methyltransferase type 12 [Methanomicrobiales archaeon HGW-Methanomicrobiales-4]
MHIHEIHPPRNTTCSSWADMWKEKKTAHLLSIDIDHEGDFWLQPDNVERYLRNARGQYGQVVRQQLRAMIIPPNARVLDIGSGPGTLAVPLAKQGCSVTIVEQAPLMCAACEGYRLSEGADPITIINTRWEDIITDELKGPFDLVIASFSLTMEDLPGAIKTIQKVASGRVYLFWFLTPPAWAEVMGDLWQSLHNRPYCPTPLADCLWNVLYEMGIYANIEVMNPAPPHRYESAEEAAGQFFGRLECREEWQKERVLTYFRERLIPSEQGGYLFGGGSRNAKVWWDSVPDSDGN